MFKTVFIGSSFKDFSRLNQKERIKNVIVNFTAVNVNALTDAINKKKINSTSIFIILN